MSHSKLINAKLLHNIVMAHEAKIIVMAHKAEIICYLLNLLTKLDFRINSFYNLNYAIRRSER
jgi:hypothetical protein